MSATQRQPSRRVPTTTPAPIGASAATGPIGDSSAPAATEASQTVDDPWEVLASYARRAPSPHNTQPVRLRPHDRHHATLEFVVARGLPVGDPQGRFTHATVGIVVEILAIAAHSLGFELDVDLALPPLYGHGRDVVPVAELQLLRRPTPIHDLDPALILQRRTNRHPYDDEPVDPAVIERLRAEAARFGHTFRVSDDRRAVRWVKELNRDALIHDLGNDDYREELAAWVRTSNREAARRRDGLSPAAMAMPGWLLGAVLRHHWLLTAPILGRLVQRIHLATMRGVSTVGWLQGDFADPADWTRAGRVMIRLWLILTEHGLYWQPYGSVITAPDARAAMVDRFSITEGEHGRDSAWLLVRLGSCDTEPARSLRQPINHPEVPA